MNREIKFRAWDEEKKEMIRVEGLVFDRQEPTVIENIGENFKEDAGTLPLMQFTGLKDKNGKEIYEGDIVRLTEGRTRRSEIDYPVEVAWYPQHARWGIKTGSGGNMSAFYPFEKEVIGNMWENPELISK